MGGRARGVWGGWGGEREEGLGGQERIGIVLDIGQQNKTFR